MMRREAAHCAAVNFLGILDYATPGMLGMSEVGIFGMFGCSNATGKDTIYRIILYPEMFGQQHCTAVYIIFHLRSQASLMNGLISNIFFTSSMNTWE